ncbi:MAG: cytochrome b N-terminal domain-containing protein [Proteobacteria bacterium]|nr:cytochrome b N-terminal domain-containing protein [Pseudomonadota bacterium]MBU1715188.1 cytochrome b N-terminal domain-containing protein [Pseudomonadota bacterium]
MRWGERSLVALYVSVLSGVIIALQFDPSEPYYSTTNIEILAPFGSFWRSLHFFSSQLFFIFSMMHLYVIVERLPGRFCPWSGSKPADTGGAKSFPVIKWVRLILSVPCIVLLLFTGYVLRGDATGESAGYIAENIVRSVPVFGHWLNALLFSISSDGMKLVYPNHLISLGLLWGWLSWDHLRKFQVSWRDNSGLLVFMLLLGVICAAPLEPEKIGVFYIAGPWFFLGMQEMLRYVQPIWAGIIFPVTFLVALCFLATNHRWRRWAFCYAVIWLVVYVLLTARGLLR